MSADARMREELVEGKVQQSQWVTVLADVGAMPATRKGENDEKITAAIDALPHAQQLHATDGSLVRSRDSWPGRLRQCPNMLLFFSQIHFFSQKW
jgi:hypothetical protein